MSDRRPRTHTLIVELPLDLTDAVTFDYDPVYQALRLVMAVSRLAVDKVVCDDVTVTLRDTTISPPPAA